MRWLRLQMEAGQASGRWTEIVPECVLGEGWSLRIQYWLYAVLSQQNIAPMQVDEEPHYSARAVLRGADISPNCAAALMNLGLAMVALVEAMDNPACRPVRIEVEVQSLKEYLECHFPVVLTRAPNGGPYLAEKAEHASTD